ncbi:MAG: chaperonin GroEL [Planctomycetes bacterium]|nr:chaperonin GroEL [Planctomycetota bacterium]
MSKKQLMFDHEGRRHLMAGVEKLAKAVAVTLGPGGRNVMLEKKFGTSRITKDGVTVSKEVELAESFENLGAKLINEVANRTNKEVGDGTTTSVVLAHAMLREGNRYTLAGVSPVALRNGMQKAVDKAVEALEAMAVPVQGRKAIEHVGVLASNGDLELGQLFADAISKVGEKGVVKVEENDGVDTRLDLVDGMEFDKGFVSPYFITNPAEQMAVLDEPYLLITDQKLSSIRDLVPLLEKLVAKRKPLFIVAEDVEGEALAGLILNRLRGVLPAAAIKAPGFGDRRKAMLEDLAVFSGGTFLAKDLGLEWEHVDVSHLGRCKKIEIEKESTRFFLGAGKKSDIDQRLRQIDAQIEQTNSNYDREKLEERRAKLSGKIAIIRVGGHSEVEIKERKDRADDAVNATRAAVAEGIVPGSGTAYVRVRDIVEKVSAPGDEKFGVHIVAKALEAPLAQLGENAGLDGAALVAEVADLQGTQGYDILTAKQVDLLKAGIMDPVKVVRVALQNAASIAAMHLTSDTLVTELPDGEPEKATLGALT